MSLKKTVYNCFKKAYFSKLEDSMDSDDDEDVVTANVKEKRRKFKELGNVEENVSLFAVLALDDNLIVEYC